MLFTEYNEEVHIKNEKDISYKDGMDIMSRLYIKLEELDRLGDYAKAVKDPQFRDELIDELLPEDQ